MHTNTQVHLLSENQKELFVYKLCTVINCIAASNDLFSLILPLFMLAHMSVSCGHQA